MQAYSAFFVAIMMVLGSHTAAFSMERHSIFFLQSTTPKEDACQSEWQEVTKWRKPKAPRSLMLGEQNFTYCVQTKEWQQADGSPLTLDDVLSYACKTEDQGLRWLYYALIPAIGGGILENSAWVKELADRLVPPRKKKGTPSFEDPKTYFHFCNVADASFFLEYLLTEASVKFSGLFGLKEDGLHLVYGLNFLEMRKYIREHDIKVQTILKARALGRYKGDLTNSIELVLQIKKEVGLVLALVLLAPSEEPINNVCPIQNPHHICEGG